MDGAPGPREHGPGAQINHSHQLHWQFGLGTECQMPPQTAKLREQKSEPARRPRCQVNPPEGRGGRAWPPAGLEPPLARAPRTSPLVSLGRRSAWEAQASARCRWENQGSRQLRRATQGLNWDSKPGRLTPNPRSVLSPTQRRVGICDPKPITKQTRSQSRCGRCTREGTRREIRARDGGGEVQWPLPGPSDPPGPSGGPEPGLPAGARTDWRSGRPHLPRPANRGHQNWGCRGKVGGNTAGWRLSRPPRRVPSRPAPIPRLSRRLRTPRPLPRALRRRAPGPRALMQQLPTRPLPVSAVWDAPRRRPERSARTASPQPPAGAPSPGTQRPCRPGEWVGRPGGSPTEAGCSCPSPTRCRPRRPWNRLIRTRWTSAPKCSSTACCGSGPLGGLLPSGPGGECASRAPGGPPGEGSQGLRTPAIPFITILPLPAFVTLASSWFTPSWRPWKLWIPDWAGFISARGLVELGWDHWPGVVGNSLWNGSKSGWGGWCRLTRSCLLGAQLGKVGPDSAAEGEAPSPVKDSSPGSPLPVL